MKEYEFTMELKGFKWGDELDSHLNQLEIERQNKLIDDRIKNMCHCCGNTPTVNQFGS